MGRPVGAFTAARVARPRTRPGPRKLAMELRFALSNDDLNTRGTARRRAMSARVWAMASTSSSLSMTHGPAMIGEAGRVGGAGAPPSTLQQEAVAARLGLGLGLRGGRGGRQLAVAARLPAMLLGQRGADVGDEQRMGL